MLPRETDHERHRIEQKVMNMNSQNGELTRMVRALRKRYPMVSKITAQTSKTLRRRYVLTMRIIVFRSSSSAVSVVQFLQLGGSCYIKKPFLTTPSTSFTVFGIQGQLVVVTNCFPA